MDRFTNNRFTSKSRWAILPRLRPFFVGVSVQSKGRTFDIYPQQIRCSDLLSRDIFLWMLDTNGQGWLPCPFPAAPRLCEISNQPPEIESESEMRFSQKPSLTGKSFQYLNYSYDPTGRCLPAESRRTRTLSQPPFLRSSRCVSETISFFRKASAISRLTLIRMFFFFLLLHSMPRHGLKGQLKEMRIIFLRQSRSERRNERRESTAHPLPLPLGSPAIS